MKDILCEHERQALTVGEYFELDDWKKMCVSVYEGVRTVRCRKLGIVFILEKIF